MGGGHLPPLQPRISKAQGGKSLAAEAIFCRFEPQRRGALVLLPPVPFSLEAVTEVNDLQL